MAAAGDRDAERYFAHRTEGPWLLDLYCGEGGAAMGFWRAGWNVFGVDLNDNQASRRRRPRPRPLKRYPFPCIAMDALEFLSEGHWRGFAGVHASPPCQRFSPITRINGQEAIDEAPDLIEPTRELLVPTGLPYVMENVPEAPLEGVLLCGSMFDLDVKRHRIFETNWPLDPPMWPCRHKIWTPRFRPASANYRRGGLASVVPVYGATRFAGDAELRRRAMGGVNWMTREGLTESIPPVYAEFVGAQLLRLVQTARARAAA